MIIESGTGRRYACGVNSNNRLLVEAASSSTEHHVNHANGYSFNLLFSATPSGPDDCFLYIKNLDELDLIVEGFWIKLAADEYIDIKVKDIGTPLGGTEIIPSNLNTAKSRVAEGTFLQGSDIIGLSGGITTHRIYHASSNGSVYWNFNQDIIISKNNTLTMYAGTGTTALAGMLVFNYHGPEE